MSRMAIALSGQAKEMRGMEMRRKRIASIWLSMDTRWHSEVQQS